MDTLQKRLDELEVRLREVEKELYTMRKAKKLELLKSRMETNSKSENIINEAALQVTEKSDTVNQEEQKKHSDFNKGFTDKILEKEIPKQPLRKNGDSESMVGKYFIGALASLLIFIAAVSFVAIVWNKISPELKLAIVGISGFALTAIGFKMTITRASNVSSIVFGTGIGLVYIAVLSANLVFLLISHEASALLCVLWTLIILFSYRYTKLYFTMVIASIGSFINICFELGYVGSSQDIMLIIAYTVAITIMLLYMSNSLDKIRNTVSIFFTFFNFALIFLMTFHVWHFKYILAQTVVTVIMLLISNRMYSLSNRENIYNMHFFLTVFSTLFLFLNIYFGLPYMLGLTMLQSSIIFFLVIFVQCIVNHLLYQKIENWLTIFYSFVLYLTMMNINRELFGSLGMGAAGIIILFILRKKIFGKAIFIPYMMFFIFWDLSLSFLGDTFWTLLFTVANIVLLFYILYEDKKDNQEYKNVAVAMLLLGYFKISRNLCYLMDWNSYNNDIQNLIAYLLCVFTVMFIYKTGYLNGKDENLSKAGRHAGLYIFSTVLYALGLWKILTMEVDALRFIVMLAAFSITVFQTHLLLSDYEKIKDDIGIWLVLKYFIFVWVTMGAFWRFPFNSASYSVVGLLLAIIAIYAGFKYDAKSIRKFGLGITMLMVAKFIFVDLIGENSITRVIAFAIGGILCFIISIIYNRLSKE